MTTPDPRPADGISSLDVNADHVWARVAAKWGVENPLPPWKTSLDGVCDALDRAAACTAGLPSFKERRDEEDHLSATIYADLPYPESQLMSLAHSLLARGIIDETALHERLVSVRARLEA